MKTKKSRKMAPLVIAVIIALAVAGVTGALVMYFQSLSVESTITLYGADGRSYGFTSFADYATPLAEPTSFMQDTGDVRSMAVAISVDPGHYFDPATVNYYVSVSASDLPAGATGSFSVCWGQWSLDGIEERIQVFNADGSSSSIALAADGTWSATANDKFGTTLLNIDPADEYTLSLAKADVEEMLVYDVYTGPILDATFADCGGLVIWIEWDLSGCDVFGDFTPDIVVEFGAIE